MSQQLGRQRKLERPGCILSRIRVRYLDAQPFTDLGTDLKGAQSGHPEHGAQADRGSQPSPHRRSDDPAWR
jgi:hypothetical protein